jgi:hypothetical protein
MTTKTDPVHELLDFLVRECRCRAWGYPWTVCLAADDVALALEAPPAVAAELPADYRPGEEGEVIWLADLTSVVRLALYGKQWTGSIFFATVSAWADLGKTLGCG